jgi:hypothetical protein
MGNLNARVGNNRFRNYIDRHGENINNKNGEKLLKIMNTFFEHTDSHKYKWSAREHKSITETNEKLYPLILDTRVYRSFEIESDHYMLVSLARFQPKWYKKRKNVSFSKVKKYYKVHILNDQCIQWLYQRRFTDHSDNDTGKTVE